MKIIATKSREGIIVEMSEDEWTSLRIADGFTWDDCRKIEVNSSCSVTKIEKCLDEIKTIKGLKNEISRMMKQWEKSSIFIAERLKLEEPEK